MLRNVDLTIKNHLNLLILELRCGRASFEVPYFAVPYLELVLKNIDFIINNHSNLTILEPRCGRASFEVPYFEVPYLELVSKTIQNC